MVLEMLIGIKETKMITVTYDSEKMNEDKIKSKIAGAGYDTVLIEQTNQYIHNARLLPV